MGFFAVAILGGAEGGGDEPEIVLDFAGYLGGLGGAAVVDDEVIGFGVFPIGRADGEGFFAEIVEVLI